MKMDHDRACALYRDLEGEIKQWMTTYEELAWYIAPQRVGFISEKAEGQIKTERLEDSIGIEVLDDLKNYLSGALTPSAYQWALIRYRDENLNKQKEASEWLEESMRRLFVALAESNFYGAIGEFYLDIAGFGTGSLGCREKKNVMGNYSGLHFDWIHMREIVGIPNDYGEFDCTIRVKKDTAKAWVQRFGDDAGEKVNEMAKHKPNRKYTFLHIVWPRDKDDIDVDAFALDPLVNSKRLPFGSMWVNYSEKKLVKESGYYENARQVVKWDDNTDSTFGFGRGLMALPDIRSINEAVRLEFVGWSKNIDPATIEERNNVVGSLDRSSGGRIVVRDIEKAPRPLIEGTNWQVSMLKRDELVQNVRSLFYSDLIREPAATETAKTAYEVAKRIERAQRILGEAVAHIRTTLLDWVIQRSFSIMFRNNQFGEMPEVLRDQEAELDIQYTSQLALSQQAGALDNILMYMGDINQIATIQSPQDPSQAEILDHIDFDGLAKELQERRNVPAVVSRSDDDIKTVREQRQQALAKQNALAEMEVAGKAVRDVGSGAGQDAGLELVEDIKASGQSAAV